MTLDFAAPIKNIMPSGDIISVDAEDNAPTAWMLMRTHRIRHLPVLAGNEIVGLVTPRDVERALLFVNRSVAFPEIKEHHFDPNIRVWQIMSSPVAVIDVTTPINVAARYMVHKKISALLLSSNEGNFAGIVTSEDLLKLLFEVEGEKNTNESIADKGKLWFQSSPIKQLVDELASSGI